MKLTKSKLKEIIAEELALEAEEEAPVDREPDKKMPGDVEKLKDRMKGYIDKIDKQDEYEALLSSILKLPNNFKKIVLGKKEMKELYKAVMVGKA
jgi:hypothetical protein